MNHFFRELYDSLIIGIEACEKSNTDYKKHIECCFHICESVVLQVDRKIATSAFEDENEEIRFFKIVKPKFTSLVELYSIVYRAELFAPETRPEKVEYWKYELERANQFLLKHQEFHNYLKEGQIDKDRQYFLRTSPSATCSSHDPLMAQINARELYIELLEKKTA